MSTTSGPVGEHTGARSAFYGRLAATVCLVTVVVSACSFSSSGEVTPSSTSTSTSMTAPNSTSATALSAVAIRSATLSLDEMRFRLSLVSCSIDLNPTIAEDALQVVVTVLGAPDPLGRECDENIIVELASPLGERRLVDGSTGGEVSVLNPPAEEREPWPYDRTRFDKATYLEALADMVACIEADPLVDAWIGQNLDWKTYYYEVEPNENGDRIEGPLFSECHDRILEPLR